jgi:hypothetical protein
MKLLFLFLLMASSCGSPNQGIRAMQTQIDSLTEKVNSSYKPGLGDFMMSIQVHHAKLWFAGSSENWELADFETKEINESIQDIETYCQDRIEIHYISMIKPPLDSLNDAINKKNINQFKRGFVFLTNTCNDCHRVSKHAFNVIEIPSTPPFSNQSYKPAHDAGK